MEKQSSFKLSFKMIILSILILGNVLIWLEVNANTQENILKVSFLDVGQGDAIFVESPAGYQVLIDGGATKKILSEIGKELAFGDRDIDIVIATHPDTDHIGGLVSVLDRYEVGLYIEDGLRSENSASESIQNILMDKNISNLVATRGMKIGLGEGVVMTIIYPNQDTEGWDPNDASLVIRLDYRESSFLFTGDAELKAEADLLGMGKEMIDVDVLKVGHHGSKTSTTQGFLDAVTPEYSVISAGKDNKYGHPNALVLDRLINSGGEVLSTIELGTITFETDGIDFWKR